MDERIGVTICMVALGIVCYRFGYKIAENNWRERLSEHAEELLKEKLDEVKRLYEETYRNVFRSVLGVYKEVEEEKKNQNDKI